MYVYFFAYLVFIYSASGTEFTDLVDTSKPDVPVSLNESELADVGDYVDIDIKSIIIKELEKDGTSIDIATMEMIDDPLTHSNMFQGDIELEEEQTDNSTSDVGNNAILTRNQKARWPGGIMPYVVSSQYGAAGRKVIAAAAAEYAKYTCVKVIPRTNQPDYVYIKPLDGCWSGVGRSYRGGLQILSLASVCLHKSTIVHELMHSFGFYHEQARTDRDLYVNVLYHNIEKDLYDQYDKTRADLLNLPYDQRSVMHYSDTAFRTRSAAIAGRKTMISKTRDTQFGNRFGFTELDIKKINKLYGCPNRPIPRPVPADRAVTKPTGSKTSCRYKSAAGPMRAAGPDLTSISTHTAEKCCHACRSRPQCLAFTWTFKRSMCYLHRTGYQNNIRNDCGTDCWFGVVRSAGTAVTKPTGSKTSCRYKGAAGPMRAAGPDLTSISTHTAEKCCHACRIRPQCLAFTWTFKRSMCWLHRTGYQNNIRNDCGTDCWFGVVRSAGTAVAQTPRPATPAPRPVSERCNYDCAACGKHAVNSDLVTMYTDTPDECCRECRKRPQCKAMTYAFKMRGCFMHTAAYKTNIIHDCGTDCWFLQI